MALFPFIIALFILVPTLAGIGIGYGSIPLLDRFIYTDSSVPYMLRMLANFDGVHYLQIAKNGYTASQFAFFPFYPLLIKLFSLPMQNSYFFAGLLISLISCALSVLFIVKLFRLLHIKNETLAWFLVLLFTFPTSFYFTAVYGEPLFLLLSVMYLYFFMKKQPLPAIVAGFLLGTTRLVGFLYFVPGLWFWLQNRQSAKRHIWLLSAIAPLAGLGSFCVYLYFKTGDLLQFFHSSAAFGEQRSSHLILLPQVIYRYIKILLFSSHTFQYAVAAGELVTFALFFLVLSLAALKYSAMSKNEKFIFLVLGLTSVGNILLPTLSGSLSSFPRYALMTPYVFYYLADRLPKPLKIILAVIFLVIKVILSAYFSRGYFVS